MLKQITGWFAGGERSYTLRIPSREECEGILLLGDPGAGKSQIIHQLIYQAQMRSPREAGVCFDPACEFLEAHYDPRTDVVLNPLDERFPYWSPSLEVKTNEDVELVAESFFPHSQNMPENTKFFIEAARDIFALMLEQKPTATTIINRLTDEAFIDSLVAGKPTAHKINKKAGPQRIAVLSTLADLGRSLKRLPPKADGREPFSLTNWARRRQGWLYITSKHESRDALRPLQAAFLNILMKRLLSVPRDWAADNPCWVIIDEVHALKTIMMLPTFVAESRKYGVKYVFGTQSKSQMKQHYGEEAATMMAAPHLKIYMRCNESEAARWIADNIGEEERERPRVGMAETTDGRGHDSLNYSSFTERRAVVSKEQIMSLPNLHGYWKYSDKVVPFRISVRKWQPVAEDFITRRVPSAINATSETVSKTPAVATAPPTPQVVSARARAQQPAEANAIGAGDVPRKRETPAIKRIESPEHDANEIDLNF